MIRKVKILKQPKFDLTKLMELYKVAPAAAEKPAAATENKVKEEWIREKWVGAWLRPNP